MKGVQAGLKASGLWYIALEGEGRLRLVEQEGMEKVRRPFCPLLRLTVMG